MGIGRVSDTQRMDGAERKCLVGINLEQSILDACISSSVLSMHGSKHTTRRYVNYPFFLFIHPLPAQPFHSFIHPFIHSSALPIV